MFVLYIVKDGILNKKKNTEGVYFPAKGKKDGSQ